MTVDANLVAARRANALLLPAAAVQGSAAWQLVDGRARRLTLQIGTRGNGKVEVLGGLPEGAQLVLDAQGLREGQRLRATP
jgi:multidrug efflux pump subunit AcrA (membrane-fusion protein)